MSIALGGSTFWVLFVVIHVPSRTRRAGSLALRYYLSTSSNDLPASPRYSAQRLLAFESDGAKSAFPWRSRPPRGRSHLPAEITMLTLVRRRASFSFSSRPGVYRHELSMAWIRVVSANAITYELPKGVGRDGGYSRIARSFRSSYRDGSIDRGVASHGNGRG